VSAGLTPPTAEAVASTLVAVAGAYAAIGLIFAGAFVARGIDRLDPGAHGAGWGFRLLILPASTLLWPLLLRRWVAGPPRPPRERTAHDRAAEGGARP